MIAREDLIRMAREAGIWVTHDKQYFTTGDHAEGLEVLEAFAEKVAATEREACAKLCDERYRRLKDAWNDECSHIAEDLAEEIRARGTP